MTIQKILFPHKDLCTISEMYYRTSDGNSLQTEGQSCILSKGTELSFDTYFNSFSAGRWLKYTKINSIAFSLKADLPVNVKFFKAVGHKDEDLFNKTYMEYPDDINAYSKEISKCLILDTAPIECSQKQDGNLLIFEFLKPDFREEEIIFPVITAEEDTNITFIGWETQAEKVELQKIKLAVGICTYKREEFLKRNVTILKEQVLENKLSPLYKNLEVYIADNGQTLNKNLFNSDKIHLFPSKNLGGSAGFTRTMIESLIHDKQKGFTHIVFMDDDILLPISTVERLHALLLFLKEEYQESMIGGTLLGLQNQSLQVEFGAKFNGSKHYKLNNHYFDFTSFSAVCANYEPTEINYTGWWFCCLCASVLKRGLPMPYFIHFDDIEYGIRNYSNGIITMNGISIWHPLLSGKGALFNSYYDTRNQLITECITGIAESPITKSFDFDIYFDYLFTNPICFNLKLKAIKDFLKGPDYFINQDALLLQKEISSKRYEYAKLSELNDKKIVHQKVNFKKKRIERILQILSLCLPSADRIHIISKENMNLPLTSRNVFVLDENGNQGILFDSRKNIRRNIIKFLWYRHKLNCQFHKIKAEWQEAKTRVTSLEFWKNYLGS